MVGSISQAREKVLATAEMVRLWLQQAEQRMEAKAWRLLEKISRTEPVKPRTLWRKYHVQRKAIREPELDYLLRKGMVRLKDGLVETIKPEGEE